MKLIILISTILLIGCTPEARQKAWAGFVGFGEGYNAYGNSNYNASPDYNTSQSVYSSSQCTGAIVNGVCHGGVIGTPQAVCHGSMLNGQCIGTLMPY